MADPLSYVVYFLVLVGVVFFLHTRRGRGILLGGKIVKSWDGVAAKRTFVTSRVKVLAIDASDEVRLVALEITSSSIGGSKTFPIRLAAADALQLARLIEQAAKY